MRQCHQERDYESFPQFKLAFCFYISFHTLGEFFLTVVLLLPSRDKYKWEKIVGAENSTAATLKILRVILQQWK